MKRNIVLLFSLFVVLAISAQTKKVLLEQFTTERCKNCPSAEKRLQGIMKQDKYKDKVVWIAHHTGFGNDKYTLMESKENFLRFYGANSFAPAMMLDRTIFKDFADESFSPVNWVTTDVGFLKRFISKALSVPTSVSLKIEQDNSKINETNDVKIKVSGTYKNETPTEKLYVSVYLVESGIKSKTQKGVSGVYTHNHVIRKMLNGAEGTEIEWNGNTFSVEVEGKLGKYWEKENMKVVAFVSKSSKNKINNAQVLNAEEVKLETSFECRRGKIGSSNRYKLSLCSIIECFC